MTLKSRLDKVQKELSNDDALTIAVVIGDVDGIISCSDRKEGCPEYPCKAGASCWWQVENPNAKIITVGGREDAD